MGNKLKNYIAYVITGCVGALYLISKYKVQKKKVESLEGEIIAHERKEKIDQLRDDVNATDIDDLVSEENKRGR